MKRFIGVILLFIIIFTGCQHSDIPDSNNGSASPNIANDLDVSEVQEFDFSFVVKEGDFSRGERITVSVSLINQQEISYKWTGSQSNYRARVKLICNNGGDEYSISPEPIPDTDDMSSHEVKAGETRSFDFYFTLPADAVSGKYSLVCSFEDSSKVFENIFTLE